MGGEGGGKERLGEGEVVGARKCVEGCWERVGR